MNLKVKLILPGRMEPVLHKDIPVDIPVPEFNDIEGHYKNWKNGNTEFHIDLRKRRAKLTDEDPGGRNLRIVAGKPAPLKSVPNFVLGKFEAWDLLTDVNNVVTDLSNEESLTHREFFEREDNGKIKRNSNGKITQIFSEAALFTSVGAKISTLKKALEPIDHGHDDLDEGKLLLDEIFKAITSKSSRLVEEFNQRVKAGLATDYTPLQDFVDGLNGFGGKENLFTNYIVSQAKGEALGLPKQIDHTRIELFMDGNHIEAASIIVGAFTGGTHSNGSTHGGGG